MVLRAPRGPGNAVRRTFRQLGEKLYVIESPDYRGTVIYSKGKITREAGREVYYFFISSKISTFGDS